MQTVQRRSHALDFFRSVLANRRLGHAYALTGPEAVNKPAFALEVARMLLCPVQPDVGCGQCPACQRVDKRLHSDLLLFEPLPGKREIGIDLIRGELIPAVSLAPFEARWKVCIIDKADWMTEDAADCLLKTLEEPPPGSILFLLTESADLLQPTIRSRCQIVRITPPTAAELAQHIAKRWNLPPDQALALANLSDGSIERAALMQETGWQAERDAMLRALAGDPAAVQAVREAAESAALSAGRTLEAQRAVIRRKLSLLLLCCRDLLVAGFTPDAPRPAVFLNPDAAEAAAGLWRDGSHSQPLARFERLAEVLLDADDSVLANANIGLLMDYVFRQLSR